MSNMHKPPQPVMKEKKKPKVYWADASDSEDERLGQGSLGSSYCCGLIHTGDSFCKNCCKVFIVCVVCPLIIVVLIKTGVAKKGMEEAEDLVGEDNCLTRGCSDISEKLNCDCMESLFNTDSCKDCFGIKDCLVGCFGGCWGLLKDICNFKRCFEFIKGAFSCNFSDLDCCKADFEGCGNPCSCVGHICSCGPIKNCKNFDSCSCCQNLPGKEEASGCCGDFKARMPCGGDSNAEGQLKTFCCCGSQDERFGMGPINPTDGKDLRY